MTRSTKLGGADSASAPPNPERRTAPPVEISAVTKSYGRNRVLKGVDLSFTSGEFVGLMGPNGAGKSTLLKILAGLVVRDEGEILVDGAPTKSLADRPDVAFIHQDLGLIDAMSVWENLRLEQPELKLFGPILHTRRERTAARQALEAIGLDIDVDAEVASLSPGEKTLVAVARAFQRGANIIFVDEATSTLPVPDARRVVDTLRSMAAGGAIVVMVTHKLGEIMDACDRAVVLIEGRIGVDSQVAGLERADLIRLLSSSGGGPVRRTPSEVGETIVSLDHVAYRLASDVSLSVRRGEVVGITGLPGSGLHDIAEAVFKAVCHKGTITYADGCRCAFLPPHRETEGGLDGMVVRDNLTISALPRWRSRTRLLRSSSERDDAQTVADRLKLHPSEIDGQYDVLSGGNKQKVLVGRMMLQQPDLYVMCEPTRGVDIATRAEIYAVIDEVRAAGAALMVVSSDSEDLISVCDRVAVIQGGQVEGAVPLEELSLEEMEALV